MALFVDVTGFPLDVELNIAEGVGPDAANVFDNAVSGDPTVVQIGYAQSTSGFGQNRLNDVVNVLANAIVMTGVGGSFTINGIPITQIGGLTALDAAGIIRIIYDVSQCNGSFYAVFDAGGNPITCPNYIIVGHELAHAFHNSVGIAPPPGPAAEVQATNDENMYRAQFGLTLRDPNNHGLQCGGSGPPPPPPCLIASAAYRSQHAPQLNKVRRLRDVVLRRSVWGSEFFEKLLPEYYRFSPQVAAEMEQWPGLRESISRLIVQPYFQFLTILENYVDGGWQRATTRIAIDEDAALIYERLSSLKASLVDSPECDEQEKVLAAPESASVMEVFEYISQAVRTTARANGHVSWALLDPLILFWSAARGRDIQEFMNEIARWLASAPIPSSYARLAEDALAEDLEYLRDTIFTSPSIRRQVGSRLSDTLKTRVSYNFDALLKRTGYWRGQ
jgi:hypothetical protein